MRRVALKRLLWLGPLPLAAGVGAFFAAVPAHAAPLSFETTAVRDVATSWSYTCPDNACAVSPNRPAPLIQATADVNLASARRIYATIDGWYDFQYQFIQGQPDYKAVVGSKTTYDNYYLPTGTAATNDAGLWAAIYAKISAAAKTAYAAAVGAKVDQIVALVDLDVNLGTSATGPLTAYYPTNAFNVDTDFFTRASAALTKANLVSQAGVAAAVYDDLYAGKTELSDLGPKLDAALASILSGLIANNSGAINNARGLVQQQFAATAAAVSKLNAKEKQDDLDSSLSAATYFRQRVAGWYDALPAAVQTALTVVLGNGWDAADLASGLSNANLAAKFNAIPAYAAPSAPTAATTAQAIGDFQADIHKLNAVYTFNAYAPTGGTDVKGYGPAYLATLVTPLVDAFNAGQQTNAKSPSLGELQQYVQSMDDFDYLPNAAVEAFAKGALFDLANSGSAQGRITTLVKAALGDIAPSEATAAAEQDIAANGLTAPRLDALFDALKPQLDFTGQRTRTALYALGGVAGAAALGASFVFFRGYFGKRKYGASLWAYARSQKAATVVLMAVVTVAVVLLAVAGAGVL